MAGNDQAGNDKPPSSNALSLDEAERVASQFTPMWDEPAFGAEPPAAPPIAAPAPIAAPPTAAPAPIAAPPIAAPARPIAAAAAPIAPAPMVPMADKPASSNASSLDEAERVASQFTPVWDKPAFGAEPAAAPRAQPAAAPGTAAPAPAPPIAAPAPFAAAMRAPAASAPPATARPVLEPAVAVQAAPVAVIQAPIVATAPAAPVDAAAGQPLPDSKIEYAPPRALPLAQRTMLGLAPVSVDVGAAAVLSPATTTPAGVGSAPPAAPALQVVAEPPPQAFQADADDPTKMDTVPPRSRAAGKRSGRGIVLGVMGVAVALIVAMGVRKLTGPSEDATKATEPNTRTEAVRAEPGPEPKASLEPPPEIAPPAAVPLPEPPKPEVVEPPPEPPPAKAEPESPKPPARPQRPAHVARVAPAPRVERPHRAAPEPPVRSSPTGAKGGAIVRESPF